MKRLFLAIPIPKTFCKILHHACTQLPLSHARIVPEENIHITVAFLGNTDEAEVEKLKEKVDELAKGLSSFTLEFDRIGFGPTDGRPHMIWAFFKESSGFFDLGTGMKRGLHISDEKNTPHITLARLKSRPEKINFPALTWDPIPVTAIHLMESQQGNTEHEPLHPIYTELHRTDLK